MGHLALVLATAGVVWAGEADALRQRAEESFQQARYLEAAAHYAALLRLEPDRPDLYSRLVWSLFHAGEADPDAAKALLWFQQAAAKALDMEQRFPALAESHFLVAFTHGTLAMRERGLRRLEDARKAEQSARRALILDPEYAPAYVVLGIGYREMARLPVAVRWVARRLWEGDYPTFEKAEQAFREALKREPQSPFALEQMGETLEAAGRPIEARLWYQRALDAPAQTPLDQQAQRRARRALGVKQPDGGTHARGVTERPSKGHAGKEGSRSDENPQD